MAHTQEPKEMQLGQRRLCAKRRASALEARPKGSTTTIMEARPGSPQEQGDKKCAQDENPDRSAT